MKYFKHLILVIILFLVDFFTKFYFKNVNFVKNTGITFGLFKGNNLLFIFINLIIIAVILYYYRKEKKLQFGLDFVLAGALGNLFDRLVHGYVIDFIDLKIWPVFNLADSFIVIGVGICIYLSFKNIK